MQENHLKAAAASVATQMAEAENRLKVAVGKVDARVLLSSYAMYRIIGMADESAAEHGRPAVAAIELAAYLLMPHFGNTDTYCSQSIQNGIDAIANYQKLYSLSEALGGVRDESPNEHDSLDLHLRLHAGVVRGSAYPGQVDRRIQQVFSPFERDLEILAGIGPLRSSSIAKALVSQVENNANGIKDKISDLLESYAERIRHDPAQREQTAIEFQHFLDSMGCTWVPTFEQISSRLGGLERKDWDTFRNIFGLSPETFPSVSRVVDLQDRPVIFLDSDRAFISHGVTVFDAVFNYFDSLARANDSLRDNYARQVSGWMEKESSNYLKRLFPGSHVITNACYPDPDHPGGETEADVVVTWGPFLVVAESKGRKIDQNAFRGGERMLKNAIGRNIEDAFSQTQRLVRALEANPTLTLKEKSTSRTVVVNGKQLRRVMPISVTLQHLAGIPTQLAVTRRLGLFKEDAYPWSVSIDDLDVITRFSGSPDVFLHYIERRIAHQKLEIGLRGDELDIFGHYLDNRLHPEIYEDREEMRKGPARKFIAFHGGEERFDPFYTAEWYGTEPPNEPVELDVPAEVREVLDELRNRSDYGARWIAFALLGLNNSALEKLASAFRELRTTKAVGERILRITMREGPVVVNIMAHQGMTEAAFFQNVTARTRMEHYRAKAGKTVSIGINQNSDKAFEVAQWLEGEWEYEEELEKMLQADREKPRNLIPSSNAKKPGRNDSCLCGSGLKFKKCCMGRIRFGSSTR
jgi:hypothetical protein